MKNTRSIEAKFLRLVDTNSHLTKLWRDRDVTEKNEIINVLRKEVEWSDSEDIIISFRQNELYFWLITINNLVIFNNGKCYFLLLGEIKVYNILNLFPNGIPFASLQHMSLLYKNEKLEILIEKGTWHVLYNLLSFILH